MMPPDQEPPTEGRVWDFLYLVVLVKVVVVVCLLIRGCILAGKPHL